MSVIKPRTRGKRLVRHRTGLDQETHETLYAYAQFLGESPEYVLNQVIDTVLARDKDFVRWRTDHPGSYVPRPAALRGAALRRTSPGRVVAVGIRSRAVDRLVNVVIRSGESADAPHHPRRAPACGPDRGRRHRRHRSPRVPAPEGQRLPRPDRVAEAGPLPDAEYGYATMWFTTPFFAASLVTSVIAMVAYHRLPATRSRPLPRYARPETRPTPSLILGEAHFLSTPGRAPTPT
jgi:hypothetical protein